MSVLFAFLLVSGCSGRVLVRDNRPGSPQESIRTPSSIPSSAELYQTGVASWYGGKFHGRRTANGEYYDKWKMTAAHRTLPFGTRVLVENRRNRRLVTVRINDRGPFVDNRIIDLSRGAAARLNMVRDGTAPVNLYVLESSDNDTSSDEVGKFAVQVGSFEQRQNARRLKARLSTTFDRVYILRDHGRFYRVRLGPFDSRQEAVAMEEKLHERGLPTWIVREKNQ